jgi:ATP-dependent DNA helicase RecG
VVEHPERFGLAQLHQLRGRIGRGTRESFCFLLVGRTCGPEAAERLGRFAETNDGFAIAELDFELRGTGDLAGFRQSGIPPFQFLHFLRDREILESAKEDAALIVKKDMVLDAKDEVVVKGLLKRYQGLEEEALETG